MKNRGSGVVGEIEFIPARTGFLPSCFGVAEGAKRSGGRFCVEAPARALARPRQPVAASGLTASTFASDASQRTRMR